MYLSSDLKPVDLNDVRRAAVAARGCVNNIYLHWSAGRYGQIYDDYHVSIDYDGRIYMPDTLKTYKEHTWHRNSRAVGIALCGCYDASAHAGWNCNLGSNPPTDMQIEAMAMVTATICKYAGIPVDNVLTHCEAAKIDGYGPYSGDPETRWDLWYIPDYDGVMRPGGDVLRGKIRWYMLHM